MSPLLAEFARLSPLLAWAAIVTALTLVAAVLIERGAIAHPAGVAAPHDAALQPARPARRRGRSGGARRARRQSRQASPRPHVAADRTAHRGSGSGAHRRHARRRGGAVAAHTGRPLPAQPMVVAARAGAPGARASAGAEPHRADRRRARRRQRGRAGRRARRTGRPARPGGTPGHRRPRARHLAAPRPARRGAEGVRRRVRAVPAGAGPARPAESPELHPRPRHLRQRTVAARRCASGPRPRLEVRATAFRPWPSWASTTRPPASPSRGWRARTPPVRAMAAHALRGWQGPGDAPARLARHLDDTWAVAVQAARTLRSMGPAGVLELQAHASSPHLAGLLARQMLWQAGADH